MVNKWKRGCNVPSHSIAFPEKENGDTVGEKYLKQLKYRIF